MAHKYETGYLKVISDKKILLLEKFINERTPANHRIFFYIMRDLGIRPSEALSLKVGDFNFDSNTVMVEATKQSKTIIRMLPAKLKQRMILHINRYYNIIKKCKGYICFAYGHGATLYHLKYNTIHKDFYDFRKHINEKPFYDKPKKRMYNTTPHTLRAVFITNLNKKIKAKFPDVESARIVQDEIGHKDVATTMRYIRCSNRREILECVLN